MLGTDGEIYLRMPEWYDGNEEFFEIVLEETNDVVGSIIFSPGEVLATGNVSYQVYDEYQGNGYAKKALKLLAKTLFNQPSNSAFKLDEENFFISILPDNTASIKTAVGAGATFEKKVAIPKHMDLCKVNKYEYFLMYRIKNGEAKNENGKSKHGL